MRRERRLWGLAAVGLALVLTLGSPLVAPLASAQGAVVTVSGVPGPSALVYDSGKGEVFAANYQNDEVTVISDSNDTVVARVPVGLDPFALCYDQARGEVFVANNANSTVSVISDSNDSVVATVAVGSGPIALAYDSAKGEVFVANHNDNTLSVVSDSSDSVVATIPIGTTSVTGTFTPRALAYDPSKGEVFVGNFGNSSVSVVSDSKDKVVATIPLSTTTNGLSSPGMDPLAMLYDPSNQDVYVADEGANSLSVISDSFNSIISTIPIGAPPIALSFGPPGQLLVVNSENDNASVVSDLSNSVASVLPVGPNLFTAAYDSSTKQGFFGDVVDGVVFVVSDQAIGASSSSLTSTSAAALPPTKPVASTSTNLYFLAIDAAILAVLASARVLSVRRRRAGRRLPGQGES